MAYLYRDVLIFFDRQNIFEFATINTQFNWTVNRELLFTTPYIIFDSLDFSGDSWQMCPRGNKSVPLTEELFNQLVGAKFVRFNNVFIGFNSTLGLDADVLSAEIFRSISHVWAEGHVSCYNMLHLDLSAVPKIREIVSALGRALSVAWMTCGGLQFLDRILIGRQCHKLNIIDLKRYPDGINPMPEKAIAYFLFKPLVANNSAIRRELKLKTDYFPEGNQCAAMFDTIKQQFMAARVALVDFEFSWNTKLGEWDYDEFSVENPHIKRRLALSLDHPLKLTCEPINQN